jgi:predicted DCC family thiol-disulfide oxidoreductase YuxK
MRERSKRKGIMRNNAIVLFDGVCNLCNESVQFIIKRDPRGYFQFAPIQSERGRRLLEMYGLQLEVMDTFVLVEGSTCRTRSDAAIRIAKHLSGFWSILSAFSIIPRPIRDQCYSLLARNRYRWFGKRQTCMIPSTQLANRFLHN